MIIKPFNKDYVEGSFFLSLLPQQCDLVRSQDVPGIIL